MPWVVGDYVVASEMLFGQDAAEVAALVGVHPDTALRYGRVARQIPPQDRHEPWVLSWYAHQLVAALPRGERNRWLKRAVAKGWHSTDLKASLAAAGARQRYGDKTPVAPTTPREVLTQLKQDPVWRDAAVTALQTLDDEESLTQYVCPSCGAHFRA